MNIHMAAGTSMYCGPQHGPQGQYRLRTSTRPSSAARTADNLIALSSSTDCGHQHGFKHRPRTSAGPLAAGQITSSPTMASGSSTDRGGLSRRSSPENEAFVISDILPLLRDRAIVQLGSTFWG